MTFHFGESCEMSVANSATLIETNQGRIAASAIQVGDYILVNGKFAEVTSIDE